MMFAKVSLSLFVVLLAACSSSTTSTTAGTNSPDADTAVDASVDSSSPGDASGGTEQASHPDWDTCTELAPPMTTVSQRTGDGDAPAPTGGTIANGTYLLTAYTVYGASALTSDTRSASWAFNMPGVQAASGASNVTSGTFTTSNTDLTLSWECACNNRNPSQPQCSTPNTESGYQPTVEGYTATATQILLFQPYVNGGTAVLTLTKQ